MNLRLALVAALVASVLAYPVVMAQQAETAPPPAKAAPPAKAKAPANPEIVVVDPAPGSTPTGKQIFAKDRATAVANCKALCPWGGTLSPSIPPSNYWYCTCKSAVTE